MEKLEQKKEPAQTCLFDMFLLRLVYKLFIQLLYGAIWVASFFSPKAKQWIQGRKLCWKDLANIDFKEQKTIWFHIASLGEFEQATPLLQRLQKQYADHFFLITFFSPSGYEKIKHANVVDKVLYLPLDTKKNMRRFFSIVQPKLLVIVKYEYWYYLLETAFQQQIPVVLVSAIFLEQQIFFKWYGVLHRQMLTFFSVIFVQNKASEQLLKQTLSLQNPIVVAGDTRFERVMQHFQNRQHKNFDWLDQWKANHQLIVVGSSWQQDSNLFAQIQHQLLETKLLIVPHQIDVDTIQQLQRKFPHSVLYSQLNNHANFVSCQTIILDAIGFLSHLYFYADLVYVGGGFNRSGIHNILEPAVFGKAILIGPRFSKFQEAISLQQLGGVISIKNADELLVQICHLQIHEQEKKDRGLLNKNFVATHTGASDIITQQIGKYL